MLIGSVLPGHLLPFVKHLSEKKKKKDQFQMMDIQEKQHWLNLFVAELLSDTDRRKVSFI